MSTETIESATPQTRPDADVMRGVIPYLNMRGRAGEAADFYARAFGATDLGRMPSEGAPGRFMHIQVEVNGGALMLTDGMAPDEAPRPPDGLHLQLVVGDGDRWWDRAIEAGCTVVYPFEMQFWGDRWGLVRDPFGVDWGVLVPGAEA